MRSSAMLGFVVVAVLVGCGGKIVESAPLPEGRTGFTEEAAAEQEEPGTGAGTTPGFAAPTSTTPRDACEVLCERDARCDTTLPALPAKEGEGGDCRSRCASRLTNEKCGMDEWLLCYAAAVVPDACTPLPEECRPAFCAWARCAKQPVSNCE